MPCLENFTRPAATAGREEGGSADAPGKLPHRPAQAFLKQQMAVLVQAGAVERLALPEVASCLGAREVDEPRDLRSSRSSGRLQALQHLLTRRACRRWGVRRQTADDRLNPVVECVVLVEDVGTVQ
jgi:hypothetical protein